MFIAVIIMVGLAAYSSHLSNINSTEACGFGALCSAQRGIRVFSGQLWSAFLTFLCLSLKYVSGENTLSVLAAQPFPPLSISLKPIYRKMCFSIGGINDLSQKTQIKWDGWVAYERFRDPLHLYLVEILTKSFNQILWALRSAPGN